MNPPLTGKLARLAELYYITMSIRVRGEFPLSIHWDRPDIPPPPIYLRYPPMDVSNGQTLQELFDLAAELIIDLMISRAMRPAYFAGIPNGVDPIVTAIANQMHLDPDRFTVRLHRADDTFKIAGAPPFSPALSALVIDDHTSSDRNTLQVIRVLRGASASVTDVITVVDRQQGAAAHLNRQGVNLHSLLTLTQLLEYGLYLGRITSAALTEVTDYMKRNQPTL